MRQINFINRTKWSQILDTPSKSGLHILTVWPTSLWFFTSLNSNKGLREPTFGVSSCSSRPVSIIRWTCQHSLLTFDIVRKHPSPIPLWLGLCEVETKKAISRWPSRTSPFSCNFRRNERKHSCPGLGLDPLPFLVFFFVRPSRMTIVSSPSLRSFSCSLSNKKKQFQNRKIEEKRRIEVETQSHQSSKNGRRKTTGGIVHQLITNHLLMVNHIWFYIRVYCA